MARRRLTDDEVQTALKNLPGWKVQDGKLNKTFKFPSFAAAMGWMTSLAIEADKLDHHPNWSNVYNRVTVELWTHDMGALSTLDVELASKMEELAG